MRNITRIAGIVGQPRLRISTAPTQLTRQSMRPSERSKLPVISMIDWPSATMATVEVCRRIVFQLVSVRKYCAPNRIWERMENTTISNSMPTREIQFFRNVLMVLPACVLMDVRPSRFKVL